MTGVRKINSILKILALMILVQFIWQVSVAQKQTTKANQVWFGYLNQTRVSDKWGLWFDGHLRTKEKFATNFSTSILRLGLTYYLADNTRLTAGYGWINNFPGDIHPGISRPEHRPWQQFQWVTKYSRLRTSQYFRLEERFRRKVANANTLAEGYNFNYRLRYNFLLTVPLGTIDGPSSKWSLVLNDEAMVNFGKEIVNNYFDQNRLFLGVALQTNKSDNLQFGYLNVFSQLASGNRYRSVSAPRIYYFHNLDLRTKK